MVTEIFVIFLKFSIPTGLRQAPLPLPCRSCDWPDSLKPSHTTDTLSSTESIQHPPEPIFTLKTAAVHSSETSKQTKTLHSVKPQKMSTIWMVATAET
jgi:hypothetical protein